MGSGEDGAGVGVVDEFKPTLGFSVYRDLESIASGLKSVDPANQRSSGLADSKHPRHVPAIEACADIERSVRSGAPTSMRTSPPLTISGLVERVEISQSSDAAARRIGDAKHAKSARALRSRQLTGSPPVFHTIFTLSHRLVVSVLACCTSPGGRVFSPVCPVASSPRSCRASSAKARNCSTTSGCSSAKLTISPMSASRSYNSRVDSQPDFPSRRTNRPRWSFHFPERPKPRSTHRKRLTG